jgi:hypothetical protein
MGMGKLVVIIDDKLEERLRRYIASKYPTETYGKIKQIIEQALTEYLQKVEG